MLAKIKRLQKKGRGRRRRRAAAYIKGERKWAKVRRVTTAAAGSAATEAHACEEETDWAAGVAGHDIFPSRPHGPPRILAEIPCFIRCFQVRPEIKSDEHDDEVAQDMVLWVQESASGFDPYFYFTLMRWRRFHPLMYTPAAMRIQLMQHIASNSLQTAKPSL